MFLIYLNIDRFSVPSFYKPIKTTFTLEIATNRTELIALLLLNLSLLRVSRLFVSNSLPFNSESQEECCSCRSNGNKLSCHLVSFDPTTQP